jgi:hypothetical protein
VLYLKISGNRLGIYCKPGENMIHWEKLSSLRLRGFVDYILPPPSFRQHNFDHDSIPFTNTPPRQSERRLWCIFSKSKGSELGCSFVG